MGIRVFIYLRVSTDDQEDNTSLEQQEIDCREYCEHNGFIVAGVFRDVYTGSVWRERKNFMEMRAKYLQKEVDGVVVRTYSRFTRMIADYFILTQEMKENNVRLLCVKEHYDDSPIGRMLQAVQMGFNEQERETTRQRTIDGKRARVTNKKEYLAANKPPYGYDFSDPVKKSKLVINEKEAEVVRFIIEQRAGGATLGVIGRDLVARNVPSPMGKMWSRVGIVRVINNGKHLYRGVATAFKGRDTNEYRNGKLVHVRRLNEDEDLLFLPEGTVPRIVSDELAFKALEANEATKQDSPRANPNPESALLRSGFVKCGACNGTMIAINIKGRKYPCYQCNGSKKPNKNCTANTAIATNRIDDEVWEYATEIARNLGIFETAVNKAIGMDTLASAEQSTLVCIAECDALIDQYKQDLKKKDWKPATRAVLLDEMETQLEIKRELELELEKIRTGRVDYNRLKQELEDVVEWCRNIQLGKDMELDWKEKRNHLRTLGIVAYVYPEKDTTHERIEIKVAPKGLMEVLNAELCPGGAELSNTDGGRGRSYSGGFVHG